MLISYIASGFLIHYLLFMRVLLINCVSTLIVGTKFWDACKLCSLFSFILDIRIEIWIAMDWLEMKWQHFIELLSITAPKFHIVVNVIRSVCARTPFLRPWWFRTEQTFIFTIFQSHSSSFLYFPFKYCGFLPSIDFYSH